MKITSLLALFGLINANTLKKMEVNRVWTFGRDKRPLEKAAEDKLPAEDKDVGVADAEADSTSEILKIVSNEKQSEMVKNFFEEMLATTKDSQEATFRCLTVQVYGEKAMKKLNFLDKGTTCPCLLQRLCFLVADEIDENRENNTLPAPADEAGEENLEDSDSNSDAKESDSEEEDSEKEEACGCSGAFGKNTNDWGEPCGCSGTGKEPTPEDESGAEEPEADSDDESETEPKEDDNLAKAKETGAEKDATPLTELQHDENFMKAYKLWLRKENNRLRAQAKWCKKEDNRKKISDASGTDSEEESASEEQPEQPDAIPKNTGAEETDSDQEDTEGDSGAEETEEEESDEEPKEDAEKKDGAEETEKEESDEEPSEDAEKKDGAEKNEEEESDEEPKEDAEKKVGSHEDEVEESDDEAEADQADPKAPKLVCKCEWVKHQTQ